MLGTSEDKVAFARFFDIAIAKDGEQVGLVFYQVTRECDGRIQAELRLDTEARRKMYRLYCDDDRVKVGDITCNPSGVMGYLYVENNYNKVLQYMQMTGNPTDMQIIGAKGRAYLLREIAKLMQLNPDKIVPTVEELQLVDSLNKAKEQAALAQQQANVAATEAGTEGVEQRNAAGGEPSAPVAQAPEEETAATPGVGQGVNNMRAQQAAARRAVEGTSDNAAGLSAQQRGTIAATQRDPRSRAAAAARSAATRRGG